MKKIFSLKKITISKLNGDEMKGVQGGTGTWMGYCTVGCTDGCGTFASWWNCTEGDCTADCSTGYPC